MKIVFCSICKIHSHDGSPPLQSENSCMPSNGRASLRPIGISRSVGEEPSVLSVGEKKETSVAEPCELKIKHRRQERHAEDLDQVKPGLDEETAVMEASRCLGNNFCRSCDLCRYFCPDLCITRNEKTGHIEIDYDFCKGCGICAFICPKGAITMAREE